MSPEEYELIEKSIRGEASAEEKALLQAKLIDPAFRVAYEEAAHLAQSLRLYERKRLQRMLEDSESNYRRSFPYLAVAASVILLITVSWLLWRVVSEDDTLFKQYYEPYALLKLDRPRGAADLYDAKVQAAELYSKGKAAEALATIDRVIADYPNDQEILFIQGLSQLHERQFSDAAETLKQVRTPSDARWYEALALVGAGRHEEAVTELTRITQDRSSAWRDKAAALLADLKEGK